MKDYTIFGEKVSVNDVAELAGVDYSTAHYRLNKMSALQAAVVPVKTLSALAVGAKFGRMTIVAEAGRSNSRKRIYECQCECGTTKKVVGADLKSGRTVSCGCQRLESTISAREQEAEDITGRVFAHLRVIEKGALVERKQRSGGSGRHVREWACECECGKRITAKASALRKGQVTSCGCKKSARSREAHHRRAPRFSFFGEQLTLKEIAETSGWDVPTLRYRINKIGMTAEEAATTIGLRPGSTPRPRVGLVDGGIRKQ